MWENNFVNDSDEVELEAFRYCFGPLISADLQRMRKEWNLHPIRKQKGREVVSGKPKVIYHFPENYQAENCGKEVQEKDIDICIEKYAEKPTFCNPQIVELIDILLPNNKVPTIVEEALILFQDIVAVLKMHDED